MQKPVVVSVADVAASGAYYFASAADRIVAAPSSDVGSIGVILRATDLQELYEKVGVRYTVLTKGKYKDIGTDTREMTAEERQILLDQMDVIYEGFIQDVAKGREATMTIAQVREVATGLSFPGQRGVGPGTGRSARDAAGCDRRRGRAGRPARGRVRHSRPGALARVERIALAAAGGRRHGPGRAAARRRVGGRTQRRADRHRRSPEPTVARGRRRVPAVRPEEAAMTSKARHVRIAHISDIHCGSQYFVPNLLNRALVEVNDLAPDVVVVTGDLTNAGYRQEFREAREYLDRIDCPEVLVVPGNHDSRNVGYVHFERLFASRESVVSTKGVTIVGVDSTEPDLDYGRIGRHRYRLDQRGFRRPPGRLQDLRAPPPSAARARNGPRAQHRQRRRRPARGAGGPGGQAGALGPQARALRVAPGGHVRRQHRARSRRCVCGATPSPATTSSTSRGTGSR